MPRPKKERGRPLENPYPPRIDATAEQIAQTLFGAERSDSPRAEAGYRCAECSLEVHYPDTLYDGGLCRGCHAA